MAWYLINLALISVFSLFGGRAEAVRPARLALAAERPQAVVAPAVPGKAAAPAPAVRPPRKAVPESLGVVLKAPSAALIDTASGEVLFADGTDRIVPIASISKLMTALVFLDTKPDWDRKIIVEAGDDAYPGLPYLKAGDTLKVRDLFNTALTGSVNSAAMALARSTGLSRDAFVARMNGKARELGLGHTTFVEPTGYEAGNVSTSLDVARLAFYAFEQPEIRQAVSSKEYDFRTDQGAARNIPSTDLLLDSFLNKGDYVIVGAKTGYTTDAGYTLVMRARGGKGDVIGVVLGSPTSDDRFQDLKSLLAWGFRTYSWE